MSDLLRRSWCPKASLKRLTLAGLHGLDTALPHCFPASWASPCDASQPMRLGEWEDQPWHAAGAAKCGPVREVVLTVSTSPSTAQLSPSQVALTKQNVKVVRKKKTKKNKDNVRRHVTTNVDHNGDYSMTCGLKRPSLGRGGSIFQPVEKLRTVLLFRLLIASDVSTHHGGGSLNGCTR